MTSIFIAVRVLHVLLGAFWVGTILFITLFLMPAVTEAGPEGGKVMMGLFRRRLMNVLPAVGILTILSGFYAWWHVSNGFAPDYMGSRAGMAFGTGAVLSLTAITIGLTIMRPSQLGAARLTQEATPMPEGPDRAAKLTEALRLRTRAAGAGRVVAVLLFTTTLLMGVARYL